MPGTTACCLPSGVQTFSASAEAEQRTKAERAKLIKKLRDWSEDDLADKLQGCGEPLKMICTCCLSTRHVESRCRRRWCPVCARLIAAARCARFAGAVERMQWPLFVTLTRTNSEAVSGFRLRETMRAWSKLRAQRWAKPIIKGGVSGLEVTNRGRGWHDHIHAVIDCRWLAVSTPAPRPLDSTSTMRRKFQLAAAEVSERWAALVGQPSANIHIKRAYSDRRGQQVGPNSDSIVREVLKYSVKAGDLIECEGNPAMLIRAMDGCRLVTSFGSLYRIKLDEDEKVKEPIPCETCNATKTMIPHEVFVKMTRY